MHQWLELLPFEDPSNPDVQLTVGAVIVEEMRAAVESVTGFRCSAGISHNKVFVRCVYFELSTAQGIILVHSIFDRYVGKMNSVTCHKRYKRINKFGCY